MIANNLQGNFRADDAIARWGGEEFLALLHGTDRQGVVNAAEKICTLIGNSHINIDNREIKVTVSIGATLLRFEDDLAALIRRADQNMYASKVAGRNRASFDPPEAVSNQDEK
jgi:diguanylate cyclase (GGDEF)-like protein